jgi:nucleoside-diphosphate-sugar epimerase
MRRLLITGTTGFLGWPCTIRALERGWAVHGLARKASNSLQVSFHAVNLFEPREVEECLAAVRPTHLLHLAWIATPGVYWTSPENCAWVKASQQLLEAFSRFGGRRVVIAGTCAEYDWTGPGICRESETPLRPSTLYGQCKSELREWAEAFGRDSSVSVAWARLFFLYGLREHPARLVPSVARALLAGEVAECSAGTQRRDFLHIDDLADALLSILESDIGGAVNVGSGEAIELKQVIETVAEYCGRPDLVRLGARPTPASEPALLVADVSRLRDEVGWKPRIALEEGLKQIVDWWRTRHAA